MSTRLRQKGRNEGQDTSALIRSVQFLVSGDDDDCTGGGALTVKQRNGGIALESVVDLHSLESIVASANEAKAIFWQRRASPVATARKKS